MIENNSTASEEKQTVAESLSKPVGKKGQVVVTSTVTIDFPSLGWSIAEGDTKELPDDTDAQKIILACGYITLVK